MLGFPLLLSLINILSKAVLYTVRQTMHSKFERSHDKCLCSMTIDDIFFALLPNLSVRSLPLAHNCYSGQPQMGAERTKPRWAPDYLLGSSFNFGNAVQVDVQNDQSFDGGFGSSSSN